MYQPASGCTLLFNLYPNHHVAGNSCPGKEGDVPYPAKPAVPCAGSSGTFFALNDGSMCLQFPICPTPVTLSVASLVSDALSSKITIRQTHFSTKKSFGEIPTSTRHLVCATWTFFRINFMRFYANFSPNSIAFVSTRKVPWFQNAQPLLQGRNFLLSKRAIKAVSQFMALSSLKDRKRGYRPSILFLFLLFPAWLSFNQVVIIRRLLSAKTAHLQNLFTV